MRAKNGTRIPRWARRWGALALAISAVVGVAMLAREHVSLEALQANATQLQAFAQARPLLACALYFLAYMAGTFLLIPGILWLSIAGGFVFGAGAAIGLTWAAAMIGATTLFLAARGAYGRVVAGRAQGWLLMFREGFRRDAFSYLLSLRLLPFAPFFAVNLAPAFLGVGLRPYVAATAIGVLPGTILYSLLGQAAQTALIAGESPDLSLAARPEIWGGLLAGAVLVIAPVLVRLIRVRRRAGTPTP